jgi:hypothetical protein
MLIDLLDVNKKRPAVISAIIDAFSSLLSSECTKPSMTENLEVIAQRTLLKYLDDRERGI